MNRPCVRWIEIWGFVVMTAVTAGARAGELELLLEEYRHEGVPAFDPAAGEALWRRDFGGKSCTSCHTDSPRNAGRHDRTGKDIGPLAPSVNPGRLTRIEQMKKWLLRNCKSTLGRECSAQEKGDLLTWLAGQ